MSDYAQRFVETITRRAEKTRRVALSELWTAFHELFPHLRGAAVARAELLELVEAAVEARVLRMPRALRLYDRFQQPHLPLWVELAAGEQRERPIDRAQRMAWHPALEFVRGLPRLRANELEELIAIQRFLANVEQGEPTLTVRERSLRLFGDEKRLEELIEGPLFLEGRLTLELLRCHLVHMPFVYRDFGGGSDVLVIENKDTFESACRARRSLQTCAVRWIVFGSGNAILRSYSSLVDLPAHPRSVHYFGDIDQRGLEIAVGLEKTLALRGSLPPLICAAALYERLVARAAAEAHRSMMTGTERVRDLVAWLPESIRNPCSALVARQGRWPQEWVVESDFTELLPRVSSCP